MATEDQRAKYAAYDEAVAAAAARLKGRTIAEVSFDSGYGRTNAATLRLDDGAELTFGWWGAYTDDGGLEITIDGTQL